MQWIALFLGILVIGLTAALVTALARSLELSKELGTVKNEYTAIARQLDESQELLQTTLAADNDKTGWLDQMEDENRHLRSELEKRPKWMRRSYKILTLGMKSTGKTSLTLKWANPLVDLGTIQGTKIERYERTVSHVFQRDIVTEHVFEVSDWGGEHLVEALQELMTDEIFGLLMVVDLGGKDARQVEPARVQVQLQQFRQTVLQFFFAPKTVASCKTVVLFINKADLIPASPQQIEEIAKGYYAPLINELNTFADKTDVRIIVGSAVYGHGTHLLFAHFVEKILPKNAYDSQLLQRLKQDLALQRALGFQV